MKDLLVELGNRMDMGRKGLESLVNPERRCFLKATAAAAAWSFGIDLGPVAAAARLEGEIRIGLIADLHHDLMHDGMERLRAFTDVVKAEKVDAIIQLGDFAYPSEGNREVIDLFNQSHTKALHVIGNHDTDARHTKQQCLQLWGMPSPYYSTSVAGLHLIVLDGNEKGSPTHKGGYVSFIGPEQCEWLKAQLQALEGPCLVISHQPLAGPDAVDNAAEVQGILAEHADRVLMAINGHTHLDALIDVGGVPYLHINSAAYRWVGGNYRHESYSKEIHSKYPWISSTCPYEDSLFAMLRIDPQQQVIELTGRVSQWVGKTPADLGVTLSADVRHGIEVVPQIRDRSIATKFGTR